MNASVDLSHYLLPGYPRHNAILKGLAVLLEGGDVEEAMFERDQALPTPQLFLEAAWEAVSWLVWPTPFAQDLIEQMAAVAARLPSDEQQAMWGEALPTGPAHAWQEATRNE